MPGYPNSRLPNTYTDDALKFYYDIAGKKRAFVYNGTSDPAVLISDCINVTGIIFRRIFEQIDKIIHNLKQWPKHLTILCCCLLEVFTQISVLNEIFFFLNIYVHLAHLILDDSIHGKHKLNSFTGNTYRIFREYSSMGFVSGTSQFD